MKAKGGNARLDRWIADLRQEFADLSDLEFRSRGLVDRMALALQAALLVQHAPAFVADAFCASRLDGLGERNLGALPRAVDCAAIIKRAAVDA
jgi:putative acyl-CoA dehydrogenase